MKRFVDVRALIFWVMALVCLVMLIPCPEKFQNVGVTLVVVYTVLGAFSWLDALARARSGKRR